MIAAVEDARVTQQEEADRLREALKTLQEQQQQHQPPSLYDGVGADTNGNSNSSSGVKHYDKEGDYMARKGSLRNAEEDGGRHASGTLEGGSRDEMVDAEEVGVFLFFLLCACVCVSVVVFRHDDSLASCFACQLVHKRKSSCVCFVRLFFYFFIQDEMIFMSTRVPPE